MADQLERRAFLSALAVLLLAFRSPWAAAETLELGRDNLQAVIDALPDGATLDVPSGIYEVERALRVTGKRCVTIRFNEAEILVRNMRYCIEMRYCTDCDIDISRTSFRDPARAT